MKTLREQYTELNNKIHEKFTELIAVKDYNFTLDFISEQEDKETVKNLIDDEDWNELYEYDFEQYLEQIFYNDRRGDEKMCYLLGINKETGLYVMDSDSARAFYIGFNDLNTINCKINVIEKIEE